MKVFVAFFFLSMCTSTFYGQVRLGIKGAWTRAWQEYDSDKIDLYEESHVEGKMMALLLYYQINPYLSLGMEPGFVEKGATTVPSQRPVYIYTNPTYFLDYIQIPILIKGEYPFWKKRMSLYSKIGYGISLLVGGYQEITDFRYGRRVHAELDINNSYVIDRSDQGIYHGAGLTYQIGRTQIFVESEIYMGISDTVPLIHSKNRSISVNLGLLTRMSAD